MFGKRRIPYIVDGEIQQPARFPGITPRSFFKANTMFQVIETFLEDAITLWLFSHFIENRPDDPNGLIHMDSIAFFVVGEFRYLQNAQRHESLFLADLTGGDIRRHPL